MMYRWIAAGIRVAALTVAMGMWWAGSAQAQKWSTAAAFPAPSEELYGVAAGGRLYVFGGQEQGWKSLGMVFEYRSEEHTSELQSH